jgi:hypothetical protein
MHIFLMSYKQLEQLSFSTTFDLHDIKTSLAFDVEAIMDIGASVISLDGQYSLDGNYSLDATFSQLNFSDFSGIFAHFYTEDLVEPSIDFEISSASLEISKDSGFSFDIHELRVEKHVAYDVNVQIGSRGVVLDVTFGDKISYMCGDHPVDINEAHAKISFLSESGGSTSKSMDILISGTLEWESHKMDAGLHLYRSSDGTLDYTVVAQFSSSGRLVLSHIIPGLEHTFLKDITLQSAGLAIASRSDPQLGALGVPCQIDQGMFIP